MPQNNQDIVNSQEFKDFRKDNNLEVLNLEAMCVLLFQFQERQNEIAKAIIIPERNIEWKVIWDGESLFDKWNNENELDKLTARLFLEITN